LRKPDEFSAQNYRPSQRATPPVIDRPGIATPLISW
jgi:hypothetical protein